MIRISDRFSYIGAFVLGALLALLLAVPARSAEPFVLDRVGVIRFTDIGEGKLRRDTGVLFMDGRTQWRGGTELPRPANTPDWALGRTLITLPAWSSYFQLGFGALANFTLSESSVRFAVGTESYHFIDPVEDPIWATGRLVNLSTRAVIAPGQELTSGFVISDRPRFVLVRAVGPSLRRLGVTGAANNPFLSIRRSGQTIRFSNDWSAEGDQERIRLAAARVGAFPLDEGSLDAARVIELAPGAYTAHLELTGANPTAGDVLLEIYTLPDEPEFRDPVQ